MFAAAFAWDAKAACHADPADLFRASPEIRTVYECAKGEDSMLCAERAHGNCQRLDLGKAVGLLSPLTATGPSEKVLAAYMAAMKLSDTIFVKPVLSIQTGRYPQITASKQALNSKCMATIVQAAYKLHTGFPNYSFVIDSHIHNCQNLREGIKQLLAETDKVKRNLDRFHSPLHSVYLSNRSGFNHNDLGKMGLYVNVDETGEIRRLMIDGADEARRVSQL